MRPFLSTALLLASVVPAGAATVARPAEFVGPFPSCVNVKTEFGAVGDGQADDTVAIQRALVSVRSKDSPQKVLYFPAGTSRITDTIQLIRITDLDQSASDVRFYRVWANGKNGVRVQAAPSGKP